MSRVRSVVAAVLVLVGALLAPAALTARWTDHVVGDTDRYVETVAPLADSPPVQAAVAGRISAEVLAHVDVEALADAAVAALAGRDLPPTAEQALRALGPPLADRIRGFIEERVLDVVRSDAFSTAWDEANRAAHAQLVAVLTGEGAVRVGDDGVSVGLAAFVEAVRADLLNRGFAAAERIPPVEASFTLVWPEDLARAQRAFAVLDATAAWLPLGAVALLAAGIGLARRRRVAVVSGALTVAAATAALGVAIAVARPLYLDAVPAELLPVDAAGAVFDTLLRSLRDGVRAVVLAALLVAVGTALTGRSAAAVSVRRTSRRAAGGVLAGARGLVAVGEPADADAGAAAAEPSGARVPPQRETVGESPSATARRP
jgi:hypothetical protein